MRSFIFEQPNLSSGGVIALEPVPPCGTVWGVNSFGDVQAFRRSGQKIR